MDEQPTYTLKLTQDEAIVVCTFLGALTGGICYKVFSDLADWLSADGVENSEAADWANEQIPGNAAQAILDRARRKPSNGQRDIDGTADA